MSEEIENPTKLHPTTDYGLAAWLIDVKRVDDKRKNMKVVKRGKGVFFFEFTEAAWFEIKKEYDQTAFCDFAKRMARLRDLTF